MLAREDIAQGNLFRSSSQLLRNFRINASGAISRRWGTQYVDTAANANVVFHPFVFDSNEKYLLVFDNNKFTSYSMDEDYVITDDGDTTGADWTTAMLPALVTTQSANTMIVTHGDMIPQVVLRTSLSTFSISDFAFDENSDGVPLQPYFNFSTAGTTLSFSADTGSVTVTASNSLFDASHVNSYWRVKHGTNDWKYFEITAVTNGTTATATIVGTLNATTATIFFGEPAWSSLRGWPKLCAFYSGRLWFFNTDELPNYCWASQSNDFYNFDTGTALDAESIFGSIQSRQVNSILGVSVVRHLHIFTDQGEFYVPSSGENPVTPSSFSAIPQTNYGSRENVQPVSFDGASLFLQRNGNAIREFLFTDLEQSYSSNPVSLIAEHLIVTPTKMQVLSGGVDSQEQYCFINNSDGTLAVLQSQRNDNITNFSLWTTDGTYEDICVVDEVLFALVKRTINESTVYYIEVFREDRYLDCGSVQTDTAKTTWGSLTFLEAETVQARSENLYLGEYTVNGSGQITLDSAVASVEIGLPYTATMTSMPVALASEQGSFMGEIKRLTKVSVRFNQTVNCEVDGARLIIRNVTDDFSLGITPYSGFREFILGDYSADGSFTIEQSLPLPLTVLGYNLEVMA